MKALADVAWVEPDAIAKTCAEALAGADASKSAPGAAARVAYVATTPDIAAARKTFDDESKKLGLTVIDDAEPGGFVVTVEDSAGRRAMVKLNENNGEIVIVPRPTKTKPPGACVAIPAPVWNATVHAGGVSQDGEYSSRDITWRLTTTRMLDVDGDAILDAFVPDHRAGQCPEEGTWDVYVVRGACGHALGTIGPGWSGLDAALVPLDRSGYRPLTIESEHARRGAHSPIPEMVTTTAVYKVKRKAYRLVSAKRRSGICHHCAVWYCTTP